MKHPYNVPETLEKRIAEIARNAAPDYPNLEKCTTMEQLWAIESTLIGTTAANEDWKKWGFALMSKFNITPAEATKIFNEIQKEK